MYPIHNVFDSYEHMSSVGIGNLEEMEHKFLGLYVFGSLYIYIFELGIFIYLMLFPFISLTIRSMAVILMRR